VDEFQLLLVLRLSVEVCLVVRLLPVLEKPLSKLAPVEALLLVAQVRSRAKLQQFKGQQKKLQAS
jgi:hypothetical protein